MPKINWTIIRRHGFTSFRKCNIISDDVFSKRGDPSRFVDRQKKRINHLVFEKEKLSKQKKTDQNRNDLTAILLQTRLKIIEIPIKPILIDSLNGQLQDKQCSLCSFLDLFNHFDRFKRTNLKGTLVNHTLPPKWNLYDRIKYDLIDPKASQ